MDRQKRRKETIIEKYGSFKDMLKKRDVRDLILGGYNGGVAKTEKGFSKWEEGKLSEFASNRKRDSNGRFLPKEEASGEIRSKDSTKQTNR